MDKICGLENPAGKALNIGTWLLFEQHYVDVLN